MLIKNNNELISHGNRLGRKIVLDVIEHALRSIDSYELTKKLIQVKDGKELIVGNIHFDIPTLKNIFVIGAGKATFPIAKALEDSLGNLIEKGVIIVKKGEKRRLNRIKVLEACHPIPCRNGLKGAEEIVRIANEAGEDDLVFCIITGGASALMPYPARGISLKDKKKITKLLLKCGANINEINAVRNHISMIKGGRLAQLIHPAEIINLIVVDEILGLPWGPTVPDLTTFKDAIHVLKKYNLWIKTPISIRNHLRKGLLNPDLETPKPKDFREMRFHNFVLADNKTICESAKRRAMDLGFNSIILSTVLEGESREAGIVLGSIAREIEIHKRPLKPPCILIIGGETIVTISGRSGLGGPSQELVLGSSLKIEGSKKIIIASIDTDGTDGPTNAAGGIVDGYTVKRAKKKGIDIYKYLMRHDSYHALKKLGDIIVTGPTETNVMDLNIVAILK